MPQIIAHLGSCLFDCNEEGGLNDVVRDAYSKCLDGLLSDVANRGYLLDKAWNCSWRDLFDPLVLVLKATDSVSISITHLCGVLRSLVECCPDATWINASVFNILNVVLTSRSTAENVVIALFHYLDSILPDNFEEVKELLNEVIGSVTELYSTKHTRLTRTCLKIMRVYLEMNGQRRPWESVIDGIGIDSGQEFDVVFALIMSKNGRKGQGKRAKVEGVEARVQELVDRFPNAMVGVLRELRELNVDLSEVITTDSFRAVYRNEDSLVRGLNQVSWHMIENCSLETLFDVVSKVEWNKMDEFTRICTVFTGKMVQTTSLVDKCGILLRNILLLNPSLIY